MIKIACVGDVMPAGVHHGKKDNYIKSDVLEFLKSFDIRVATLECAIGDKPSLILRRWYENKTLSMLRLLICTELKKWGLMLSVWQIIMHLT